MAASAACAYMDSSHTLDRAPHAEAAEVLRACCGSTRWVERMLDRRPFGSQDALLSAARAVWLDLSPDDWREAFADHPRIGDRDSLARRFPSTHHLSSKEQAGVDDAGEDVLDALARANQEYRGDLRLHLHRLRHRAYGGRDAGDAANAVEELAGDRNRRRRERTGRDYRAAPRVTGSRVAGTRRSWSSSWPRPS